jgi:hypothetical protein
VGFVTNQMQRLYTVLFSPQKSGEPRASLIKAPEPRQNRQVAAPPYSRRGAAQPAHRRRNLGGVTRSASDPVLGNGMRASPSACVSRTDGALVALSVTAGEEYLAPDSKSGNVAKNKGASSSLKQASSFKSG